MLATPKNCYVLPCNGVGNGDFSQSLVRHKSLTAEISQPECWSAAAINDTGTVDMTRN